MSELQEAFREAARREFLHVPAEEDLHHVFSARFERNMRRMIRANTYGYWHLINTAAKRVLVAAVLLSMLIGTIMAFRPIRERVIRFFVEVYEEYFEVHFGEKESWDLPERTEPMERYTLTELPEGYEEERFVEFELQFWTEWENGERYKIILQQEFGTQEVVLNSKFMPVVYLESNGMEVAYQLGKTNTFTWEQHGYTFVLTIHEDISVDDALTMIESLCIAEE